MRTTTLAYITAVALMVALVAGSRGAAQAPQPAGPRPALFVSASSVSANGGRLGGAGGEHPFVPGQDTTRTLFAGNLATGTTCNSGTSSSASSTSESLARHQYVWQITTSPARHEQGQLFFDLEWARYAATAGMVPEASGRHAVALDEGERLVLDLVHAAPEENCRSVLLEIEARTHEDPALADLLIRYDVWLLHTDPAGRTESQWVVTTARHGIDVPFGLAAQRLPVPRLASNQLDFDVSTRVAGRLKGRLNADGTLSVDLLAERQDALERRDGVGRANITSGANGARHGQGRLRLQMHPGEAVRIDLPAPTGAMSQTATPGAPGVTWRFQTQPGTAPVPPAAPVGLTDGRLTVSMPAFFDGHSVALVLQARLMGR